MSTEGATKMAGENHGALVRGIERIFKEGSLTGLSEGQFLRRFAEGDEVAFDSRSATWRYTTSWPLAWSRRPRAVRG
jgi:hypothetical protein